MRTFLAFDIPEFYREQLKALLSTLSSFQNKGVKWVTPENLHVTLQFIGDIQINHLNIFANTFQNLFSNKHSFDLFHPKLEMVPGKNPRIIWISYQVKQKWITTSIKKLRQELKSIGYQIDNKPIRFHITLGRIKNNVNEGLIKFILNQELPETSIPISQITFYKSTLKPEGPIYEGIETYPLKEKNYG